MIVRCPTNKRTPDDIVGCGYTFEAEPDDELLVDCPKCGIWFPPKENTVSWNTPKYATLPPGQIPEVLTGALQEANGPRTVYLLAVRVGFGMVDAYTTRGHIALPWDWFEPSGDGTRPNFDQPAIVDHGQSLRLGEYEVSTERLCDA